MSETIKAHSKPIRLFYFWVGLVATLAYRIIIVLNYYSTVWVKMSWYIGTVGFILYFWHRYSIQKKRSELVRDHNLVKVVENAQCSNEEQKRVLKYIVETTMTSRAKYNSLLIFILSIAALLVGIVIDILQ